MTVPNGLTDANRRIFYRLVTINAVVHARSYGAQTAASRSTSLGSCPNSSR